MNAPDVDIGILTIRDDEFGAVLKAFPENHSIYAGQGMRYTRVHGFSRFAIQARYPNKTGEY
jgi:hypothetical protein